MMKACVCVSGTGHEEADGTKKKTDRSVNPGTPQVSGTDSMLEKGKGKDKSKRKGGKGRGAGTVLPRSPSQ